MRVEDRVELAHMPVVLTKGKPGLTMGKPSDKVVESVPQWMDQIVWDPVKESNFLLALNSVEVHCFF